MKQLKTFESFKWETIPDELISRVKLLIKNHHNIAAEASDMNDSQKLQLELGLDKLCRDIIMSIKNDIRK